MFDAILLPAVNECVTYCELWQRSNINIDFILKHPLVTQGIPTDIPQQVSVRNSNAIANDPAYQGVV